MNFLTKAPIPSARKTPLFCPCRTAIFAAAAERAFLHYAGCCGGRLFVCGAERAEPELVLNVQVNGSSVGTVASEQVFESAREDVRSRITNAEAVMASTGAQVSDDSWDVTPTYTLESGSSTMTETEAADAICALPVTRSAKQPLSM